MRSHPLIRSMKRKIRARALAEGCRVGAGERGEANRRILLDVTRNGVERRYHATKGWRSRRVAAA